MKHIILCLLILSSVVLGKSYTIDATILGAQGKEITLEQKYLDKYIKIASQNIKENKVVFSLDDTHKKGIYQLRNGGFKVEFFFEKENLEFITTFIKPLINIEVLESEINKAFYKYQKTLIAEQKRKHLVDALNLYGFRDGFKKTIEIELEKLYTQYTKFVQESILKDENLGKTNLAKYLKDKKRRKPLYAKRNNNKTISLDELFENVDLKDEYMLHGYILQSRINLYLEQAYFKDTSSKEIQKQNLQKAKEKLKKYLEKFGVAI
jgi:hypothetical protein